MIARVFVVALTLLLGCKGSGRDEQSTNDVFSPAGALDAGEVKRVPNGPDAGGTGDRMGAGGDDDDAGADKPGDDDAGTDAAAVEADGGAPPAQDAGAPDATVMQPLMPPATSATEPWVVAVRTSQGAVAGGQVAIADDGSIYMTATVLGEATIESADGNHRTVPPLGVPDRGLLAKFDTRGVLQWVVMLGGGSGMANGLVVLADGDVLVTGLAAEDASFFQASGEAFDVAGPQNGRGPYLARYSPSGKIVWAVRGAGVGYWNHGNAVTAAGKAIYVVGQARGGDLQLGSTRGEGQTIVGTRNGSGWLARYTMDGALEWAVANGGAESSINAVAATNDAVYVGGDHRFSNTFTDMMGTTIERQSTNTYEDAYLARYDSDGGLDWFATIGANSGPSWSRVHGLAMSQGDEPVLFVRGAGPLDFEAVVGEDVRAEAWSAIARYTAEGRPSVVRKFDDAAGVPDAVDWVGGDAFVAGWLNRDVQFASASGEISELPLTDSVDGFLIGYDAAGNVEHLHAVAGEGWQEAVAVAATDAAVHFIGSYDTGAFVLGEQLDGHPDDKSLFLARIPR